MRKFLVLSLMGVGLLVWLLWPSPSITRASKTTTHKKKQALAHLPAPLVANSAVTPTAAAPAPAAPQDAESLGHECVGMLIEKALPQINDFRKKITDDPAAPVGIWMYDPAAKILPAPRPSASDFFLRGLAAANLMAGRENKNPDLTSALEFLFKAREKDPKNAAAVLFAAYIQKQLGNETGSQELLDQIQIDDMRFDTYQIESVHQMYKHVKNTQDVLHVLQLSSQLPIVDPSAINAFLRTAQRQDIGYLMIQNELDPQSKYRSQTDGDILFYASGYAHIRSISSTEAEKLPHPRLLMEKIKDHTQFKLVDISDLGRGCEVEKLQPYVDYFQEVAQ